MILEALAVRFTNLYLLRYSMILRRMELAMIQPYCFRQEVKFAYAGLDVPQSSYSSSNIETSFLLNSVDYDSQLFEAAFAPF